MFWLMAITIPGAEGFIYKFPNNEPRDRGIKISFKVGSSPESRKRLQNLMEKFKLSWLAVENGEWWLNLDNLKQAFSELSSVDWLRGRIRLKPEADGEYISFLLWPDEIKTSAGPSSAPVDSGALRDAHYQTFISYSHDSERHMAAVLNLCNRLRSEGIDCKIDRYEQSPPEGWPKWMRNLIHDATFVIVICTATYKERFEGRGDAGEGKGAKWEGAIITQEIYDAEGKNRKFIPVLLSNEDEKFIPDVLSGATRYLVSTSTGYDALYRHLTKQPEVIAPPLGTLRSMPPLPVVQNFAPVEFLHVDSYQNAIDSLETSVTFLSRQDDWKWKWIAMAVHHALYSFCVIALEGGNPDSVLTDDPRNDDEGSYWKRGNEARWSKSRRVPLGDGPVYRIEWAETAEEPQPQARVEDDFAWTKKKLISLWTALARIQDSRWMGRSLATKSLS